MSYQAIVLVEDTTLSWPYPAIPNLITIADINDIELVADGFTLTLPAANNVGTGTIILFNVLGSGDFSFTLANNMGDPIYSYVTTESVFSIYLIDNSTVAGVWKIIPFGGGQAGIQQITVTSSNPGIVITNPIVQPPSGTIDFLLNPGLYKLSQIGSVGIPVITQLILEGDSPIDWGIIQLLPGNSGNIQITNGTAVASGQAANPTIELNSAVNLTQLTVGNFKFVNSSCNALNGSNLNFSTNTGNTITLNQVDIDVNGDISTIGDLTVDGDLTVNGSLVAPGTASAWVRFTDNGNTTNNITIIDSYNIASQTATIPGVSGTQGRYTITYANELNNANYAISITLIRGTETIAPLLAYPTSPINAQNMKLMTIDTLGNLLPVTDGVSVVIFGG